MKLFVTIILCPVVAREEDTFLQSLEKGMRWSGKFEIGRELRLENLHFSVSRNESSI